MLLKLCAAYFGIWPGAGAGAAGATGAGLAAPAGAAGAGAGAVGIAPGTTAGAVTGAFSITPPLTAAPRFVAKWASTRVDEKNTAAATPVDLDMKFDEPVAPNRLPEAPEPKAAPMSAPLPC